MEPRRTVFSAEGCFQANQTANSLKILLKLTSASDGGGARLTVNQGGSRHKGSVFPHLHFWLFKKGPFGRHASNA